MTWQMWVESLFEHFSIPFTVAFLSGYLTRVPTWVIRAVIVLGIIGIEVYQIAVWGLSTWSRWIDTYLDMIYGLIGMIVALDIVRD